MHKRLLLPLLVLLLLLTCGCTTDMTGAPYSEIEAYRAEHPRTTVTYTVTIDETLSLTNESTTAYLTDTAQIASLVARAEYLQHLETVDMTALVVSAKDWNAVDAAFPNADIGCKAIRFLDKEYPIDATVVDLSDLTTDQISEAAEGLKALNWARIVELCKEDGTCTVTLDDASALHALCPDLQYNFRVALYGQTLTTDMERVEYWRAGIKDEGLADFRKLIPLMYNLNYLKLDWCGTSNEAMAQLRDDFPHVKVVWRIFFHEYNCLTDTLKIWANWTVNDMNNDCLKYCTDVKYLDLGHTMITHCEWARNMPDLEVVIMGDCNLKSIEPLRECPKITYLEIFSSKVTDLSPL